MTNINLQPTLEGELVALRPLRADDWDELFAIASDPLIWEQHPERNRGERDVFRTFFEAALREVESGGGAFAVLDKATGRIIGCTRYHGYNAAVPGGEIEIGWSFLARSHWGGRYNPEMKRLMLAHAFTFVERVVFFVGEHNIRSQTAMERLGASRVGIIEGTRFGSAVARSVKYVMESG